jgi:probable F420-dependent oxidoreductase
VDVGIVNLTGTAVPPQRLAVEVEARGFESLFYPEHTHIPIASRRDDGRPARNYATSYDPFVALAAAAAATTRLTLGTAVTLLPQRDAIITAKEVASLDVLSGGRILLGVGPGWNEAEMRDHGVAAATRFAHLAESVAAMRRIWSDDEAEFSGQHVRFPPMWSWPKPSSPHGPPVLVGGNGPHAERRVLDYGDGWLPQLGPFGDIAEVRERITRLQARAAEQDRARIPVTMFGVPQDAGLVDELADAGVDRCLALVAADDLSQTLSRLDEYAALLDRAS